jgi:hypothetical protein
MVTFSQRVVDGLADSQERVVYISTGRKYLEHFLIVLGLRLVHLGCGIDVLF